MIPIFLDCETIACQSPFLLGELRDDLRREKAEALSAVCAPRNFKDPDKIKAHIEKAIAAIEEEFGARELSGFGETCFDGAYGSLAAVGFAVGSGAVRVGVIDPDLSPASEETLIAWFFLALEEELRKFDQSRAVGDLIVHTDRLWVGHNIVEFDLPFIEQRAIIHRVRPIPFFPRRPEPWSPLVYDTMLRWSGRKPRHMIKLSRLCKVLGVRASETSGSEVAAWARAGNMAAIEKHCAEDIEAVRGVYERMTIGLGDPAQAAPRAKPKQKGAKDGA